MTPTTLIIFGATGDLAERKLIPALFDLYLKNLLPKRFNVVGVSRKEKSDDEFCEFATDSIKNKKSRYSKKALHEFLKILTYQQGDIFSSDFYKNLSKVLFDKDKTFGQCSDKLFYLAVPPALYDPIFQNLADSGLSIACSDDAGWTRILVEKPFGNNLETSQKLDRKLGLFFNEEQIFRIDHYLAKETLQNILAFRFSNALFEPIWNRDHINRVEVRLLEGSGIEGRGEFYDGVGALRDVGQNHVLQMLSFVAMEDPKTLDAAVVRKNRARVLEKLRPIDSVNLQRLVSRGQYNGFTGEKSVDPKSTTETYFKICAYVDNSRWQGVPFILESGKKMRKNLAEISVYFKETESCLCPPEAEIHHQNIFTFHIQPREGISVLFWSKKPGFKMELEPRELSFNYGAVKGSSATPDAYERILYDCIEGDQTLFASTEEVEAAWKFITPILENWKKLPLNIY